MGSAYWAWCVRDPASGLWQVVESYKDVIRVKLTEDLYECGRAKGARERSWGADPPEIAAVQNKAV